MLRPSDNNTIALIVIVTQDFKFCRLHHVFKNDQTEDWDFYSKSIQIVLIIIIDRFNLESYEILYGLFEYTTVVPDIIDTVTKTCKCKIQ